jgi:hypothetical protein
MRSSDLVAALALVLVPSLAHATPNFPGTVQAHLGLAAAPPCTLCHQGPTQRGTVTTPFGRTARSRGLVAYDEASLATALDAMEAEGKDSDGDGTSDIRELRDGTDPNGGAGASSDPVPDYGCATSRGASSSSFQSVSGLVISAILAGIARGRGRRAIARDRS